jgi:hypothetical protein
MSAKPFAFILMPFDPKFDDIYKLGIKAAATDADVIAERVDEQTFSENILDRIYRQISVADFIIADMTGRNANVFYEVGYAHAKSKLCTLLTQDTSDIPFDLKHHRHIVYGNSIQTLKAKLASELMWLIGESEKAKSESISVEVKSATGYLNVLDWKATGELSLLIDLYNRSRKRSPEIEAIYLYTAKDWSFSQGGEACPVTIDPGTGLRKAFVKPPIQRLSPGAWAQLKLAGERDFWYKWDGTERRDNYSSSGNIIVEIQTSEGVLTSQLPVSVEFDEVPF